MPFFMQAAFLMVLVAIVKAIDRVDYHETLMIAFALVIGQLAFDFFMVQRQRRAKARQEAFVREAMSAVGDIDKVIKDLKAQNKQSNDAPL